MVLLELVLVYFLVKLVLLSSHDGTVPSIPTSN